MTDPRPVEPLADRFDAVVTVPGSKSLTNRALVCAALADGTSELTGVLFADDTEAMVDSVRKLGARVDPDPATKHLIITGTGGSLPPGRVELNAIASGTTARFLLPAVSSGSGTYVVDGAPPLRARPMKDAVDLLRGLGLTITPVDGRLPVTVTGGPADSGPVTVPGNVSSQFLSGVLLAAPLSPDGREVTVQGDLVSRPYIDMTVAVMRSFGAKVDERGATQWYVHPTGYRGASYAIEPDASAASYFFAAAAITGGRARIDGLGRSSLQGDLRLVEILGQMGAEVAVEDGTTTVKGRGVLHGVTADLRDFSDMAQTLAVVAAFADSPTRITGIGFIRNKETDRISAVVRELARLGVHAEEENDGLVIYPGSPHGGVVETYDDHRMAMSFALVGLRVPGLAIADPDCVAKTFPDYFDVLESLRD